MQGSYLIDLRNSKLGTAMGNSMLEPMLLFSIRNVFSIGSKPQMSGIDTGGVITTRAVMANEQPLWRGSIVKPPGIEMRTHGLPSGMKLAISFPVCGADPEPACRCLIDFVPEVSFIRAVVTALGTILAATFFEPGWVDAKDFETTRVLTNQLNPWHETPSCWCDPESVYGTRQETGWSTVHEAV